MGSFFELMRRRMFSQTTPSSAKVSGQHTQASNCPVDGLESLVGDIIEVHYIDAGRCGIETGRLYSKPTQSSFYLSSDGLDMHIVYWYTTHSDGRISAVKLIKHSDTVLYSNDGLDFDYEHVHLCGHITVSCGPIRMMTQEYLNGVFG